VTKQSDIEACRELLRGGSRTFFAASLVLPRAVSDPAIALYAFCRKADDAIDLGDGGRMEALKQLEDRLALAYAGHPYPDPADRAFADVVAQFSIPRELPEALIEGLAWDTQARCYDSLSDLLAYAVRVAGTVGAMMSLLMGRREPDVVARACDLGIAMQLTNIARDVGEDARAGRLYLPRQWMRELGIDPDLWLSGPNFDVRIGQVVSRLLAIADVFYERAMIGIGKLPRSCRPGIHAARLIYAEIGREVERAGHDSVSGRAVVSWSRKLRLLGHAFAASLVVPELASQPAQFEARFLIDAVAASLPPRLAGSVEPSRKRTMDRAVWVIELFDRLERREQLIRSGRA
jgi:phytoene synthase